jgi:hypothetical protein
MAIHIEVTKPNTHILTFNEKLNLDEINQKAHCIATAHKIAVDSLKLDLKKLEDDYKANLQKLKEKAEYKYRIIKDGENELAYKIKKEIITPIEGLDDDNKPRHSHMFYVINGIFYQTGYWPHNSKLLFENGVTEASEEELTFLEESLTRPEEVILIVPARFKI